MTVLLTCAALLPAVVLLIYIYVKDRVEKEPIGLLLTLFALGAAICLPAALIEELFSTVIDGVFSTFAYDIGGSLYLMSGTNKLYVFASNFIGVALVEEGLKFLILLLVTRKNKNFNSLFDGVIYSVFVSLGFAALENVLYVLEYGFVNAVARAISAVPAHMFFAVIMGCFYSYWHMFEKARTIEWELHRQGYIPSVKNRFSGSHYLVLSILLAVAAHGFYDYCCSMEESIYLVILIAFLIFLYVVCFMNVRRFSKRDTMDRPWVIFQLVKKYPALASYLTVNESGEFIFKTLDTPVSTFQNTFAASPGTFQSGTPQYQDFDNRPDM